MFRVLIDPKGLFYVLYILLVVWTVADCIRRREHGFWIVLVILLPFVGPLMYWAFTRDWVGKLTLASQGGSWGGKRARVYEVTGEDTPAALQKKGGQLLREGRHEEAVEVLEEALGREGPHAPLDLRYKIALGYKALGRFRDASDQLSLVVGDDPKYRAGQAFLELADTHQQMGDHGRARKLFDQLIRTIRFPEARYRYGLLLDQTGDQTAASEQMRQLLDELDTAPEFHRKNNRRFARLAKRYLRSHR
jgi:hypothetical protein